MTTRASYSTFGMGIRYTNDGVILAIAWDLYPEAVWPSSRALIVRLALRVIYLQELMWLRYEGNNGTIDPRVNLKRLRIGKRRTEHIVIRTSAAPPA
jgi:hypothetical protein